MASYFDFITGSSSASFSNKAAVPAVGSPVTALSVVSQSQTLLNNTAYLQASKASLNGNNIFTGNNQFTKNTIFHNGISLGSGGLLNGGYVLNRTSFVTSSKVHSLLPWTKVAILECQGPGGAGGTIARASLPADTRSGSLGAGGGAGGWVTFAYKPDLFMAQGIQIDIGSPGLPETHEAPGTPGTNLEIRSYEYGQPSVFIASAHAGENAVGHIAGNGGGFQLPTPVDPGNPIGSFSIYGISGSSGESGAEYIDRALASFTKQESGRGGSSRMGHGGVGVIQRDSPDLPTHSGSNGVGYGAGGSGGTALFYSPSYAGAGGSGSLGCVIIHEYS